MTNYLRSLLRRIMPNSKQWTTFVSFKPPLTQLCQAFAFETILEFGPGHSTNVFIEHTNAKIISLESDLKWHKQYSQAFDPAQVRVIYFPPDRDLRLVYQYGQNFSLIFIDGGDRVAALNFAREAMDEHGLVFLHDAHREDYEAGLLKFPYIYFPERHSAVLAQDPDVFSRLKAAVPTDYSCRCQYCSSPARQAYFAKYAEP